MTKIILKNLVKEYQKNEPAVSDISFEINPGEFCVLVGPSGCGKSSILRMIAGLEDITSGEIYFDKELINNLSPAKRDIGMVFQNYALYPHLNVFENIAFPLKIKKESKSEIKEKVEVVADFLELTELLYRKPKELSGGQRQRVALGRAVIRKARLFLFDEPLSNLDAKLRVQMRLEIIKLQKKFGTTAIYVTHDQTEAMTMADKIVVLNKGKLQQMDTPENIYLHPKNIFVASFIGSPQMNLIECESLSFNTFKIIGLESSPFTIDKNLSKGKFTLGIRPEDVKVTAGYDRMPYSIGFTTKIENLENLGSEKYLYFKVATNFYCIRISDFDFKNMEIDFSQEIFVNFAYEKIHLFDESGDRM